MARILIVEDNPDNQKLIGLLLKRDGHDLAFAENAEAAHAAVAEQIPDLILMDIQLPGTDGLALTAELRAKFILTGVPVVALTANAMSGDEEKILAVCDGYIAKPINTRTLSSQLTPFLNPA
ncbi:MAG: response regulator [Candidatus Sericytochromatia bacterium]|nr:response regulator [Candidatus Sericytochromatia bacterium]